MNTHPLDDRRIISNLFYPRAIKPGKSRVPNTTDGTIPITDDIVLGYRLYQPANPTALVMYFHGNGEVASDHDRIAPLYFDLNAAFLIIDYRGYGWSTGSPLTSTLLTDGDYAMQALPHILPAAIQTLPKFIMGRSLGSAPAVYLAHQYPDQFQGLIIESGFADMPSVFQRLGIPVDLSQLSHIPIANALRMEEINMPVLVIHGEQDSLLPIENGEKLYDSAACTQKTFVRIPGAGHNDLLFYGMDRYFGGIAQFMREAQK